MAMMTCKECGNSLSDQAKTCPHCGAPAKAKAAEATTKKPGGCLSSIKWFLFIGGAFAIVIAVSVATHVDDRQPTRLAAQMNENAAGACILLTEKSLNDPGSADFPLAREARVTKTTDGTWHVAFEGRAKNGFGALMMKTFHCTMSFNDKTQQWAALSLSE